MTDRHDLRIGSWAGLVGGLAMVATMLAGRVLFGTPALPDVLADAITWLIPIEIISALIDRLKYGAKPLFFADLIIAQLLLATLFGIIYRRTMGNPPSFTRAIAYAGTLWLVIMAIVLPIAGVGLFGAGLATGQIGLVLGSLTSFVAYGVGLFAASSIWSDDRSPDRSTAWSTIDQRRRALIGRGLFGALLLLTGGLGWLALPRPAPAGQSTANGDATALGGAATPVRRTPEVTPTDDFYVVSKNFVDPAVTRKEWRLEVTGLVERPLSFSYEEFLNLPAREEYVTLTCISNEVGGDLIGNARWKGVPLAEILARAGVKPGVRDVVLRAADEYEDSIPLDRALMAGTIIAFEMNGEPLQPKHGFPARLIVPGIYGMKNVKWLKQIELVDNDFKGYWQQRGWSDEAIIQTMSRIDFPQDRANLPRRPLEITGIAFAGDRGISKVEVSTDGGQTWQNALLKEPLSPYTWVLWSLPWQPARAGYHRLVVRAYDGAGNRQVALARDPLPDGATGLHTIQINFHEES